MTKKTRDERLTVLHVATLNQPIKPDLGYGPVETIIRNIDKGLHCLGHRSIVACSGDSMVSGEHYVTVEHSIGDYWNKETPERRRTINMHLANALDRAKKGDIDVIHVHDAKTVEYISDGIFSMHLPVVMTLHVSAKDIMGKEGCNHQYECLSSPDVYCVPISEYQKRQYKSLFSTEKAVYHGIDLKEYPAKEKPARESYLFTIGRVTRDKGQDKAIEVARKTGSKLIIAGCIQNKNADRAFFESMQDVIDLSVDVGRQEIGDNYFERVIKPLLDCDKQIIFIGELNSEQKKMWYLHALGTLFPIQWGEPFGLVPVESMACGTPVLAFSKGAVPEIVVNGETGFVVDSESEMMEAVGRLDEIDPSKCRQHVRNHFSMTSMAFKYSELYREIINGHRISDSHRSLQAGYFLRSFRHGGTTN
jgi:glycosyltransferase involved in cell wall biosynthesis